MFTARGTIPKIDHASLTNPATWPTLTAQTSQGVAAEAAVIRALAVAARAQLGLAMDIVQAARRYASVHDARAIYKSRPATPSCDFRSARSCSL